MTPLEDELRGSLARQARHPSRPDPEQLAERVIRRARRVRRRRRLGGATAALALAVTAGWSVVQLPERRPAPPVAARSAPATQSWFAQSGTPAATAMRGSGSVHALAQEVVRLPVDVVADGRLVTTNGKSVDLSFAGVVSQAYRVSSGWLVVGAREPGAPASLWLIAENGRHRALLSNAYGIAVAESGQRVAWRAGARVWAGVLTETGIGHRAHTLVMGSTVPVGFVGDGVLLSRGNFGGYKMWWPEQGPYQPGWADTAVRFYGSLADERTVVAQVSLPQVMADKSAINAPQRCLALLDATKALLPRVTACGLDLGIRSPGAVSPDGRWLVTGSEGRTVLVDLTAPSTSRPRVLSTSSPAQGGVAWLDEHTVVLAVGTGKVVVQLRVDERNGKRVDGTKRWVVPAAVGKPVLVIPRLGG